VDIPTVEATGAFAGQVEVLQLELTYGARSLAGVSTVT